MDAIFAQANRFLSSYGTRVEFIRTFSTEAANVIPNESLDFVYIDGNHQSEFVTKDLTAWWPKVRPGGLVIGDDCADMDDSVRNDRGDVTIVHKYKDDGTPELYGDYGVYHALRQFTGNNSLGYVLLGTQFVIPK
jgi:predicted O-methyltransferase YrrM